MSSIWADTAHEHGFRMELRRWLSAKAPEVELRDDPEVRVDQLHRWHVALWDAGYIGLSLPERFGGCGFDPRYDAILNEELGLTGAPPAPAIGHLAHALALFGTDGQRHDYLMPMLSGAARWCQGFSEPDAGSDLGSLRCTAVLDEDGGRWRVDGQKIWTSLAAWADLCMVLCRTGGPSTAEAISMLIVPMDSPGVTCRPIVTSWGTREFAEVFFDDVTIPADDIPGRPGDGWRIANQLLAYERGPADIGWVARLRRALTLTAAAVSDRPLAPALRDQWARAHAELRVLEIHVRRSLTGRRGGQLPGPEGSLDKLLLTRADQLVNEVVLRATGAAGMTLAGASLDHYLTSRAASVFGGTSQIQATIVGERVLGLPREPRATTFTA